MTATDDGAREPGPPPPEKLAPVHKAGPISPFAIYGSWDAIERHTRNAGEVTCPRSLQKLNQAPATP
jgi:hypothetical protein